MGIDNHDANIRYFSGTTYIPNEGLLEVLICGGIEKRHENLLLVVAKIHF